MSRSPPVTAVTAWAVRSSARRNARCRRAMAGSDSRNRPRPTTNGGSTSTSTCGISVIRPSTTLTTVKAKDLTTVMTEAKASRASSTCRFDRATAAVSGPRPDTADRSSVLSTTWPSRSSRNGSTMAATASTTCRAPAAATSQAPASTASQAKPVPGRPAAKPSSIARAMARPMMRAGAVSATDQSPRRSSWYGSRRSARRIGRFTGPAGERARSPCRTVPSGAAEDRGRRRLTGRPPGRRRDSRGRPTAPGACRRRAPGRRPARSPGRPPRRSRPGGRRSAAYGRAARRRAPR
ncbi:hypothetical protein Sros_6438 [Streptosporangium roseum DSM 43021]|uniref:Uncharacterized protein n=1 Tax=Streptosporangium roseum (strain ATCC 12428 / DSM 43021 / JCM 3005 / KCTC 9067 / NCIMB 10171 / NRRL 2505 / NI 9100) TaxID=479432 RepID=D2B0E6_STRRD|nr:hypothetical protein Sros_6438 [Streptosporangium roseum DSM 43021]